MSAVSHSSPSARRAVLVALTAPLVVAASALSAGPPAIAHAATGTPLELRMSPVTPGRVPIEEVVGPDGARHVLERSGDDYQITGYAPGAATPFRTINLSPGPSDDYYKLGVSYSNLALGPTGDVLVLKEDYRRDSTNDMLLVSPGTNPSVRSVGTSPGVATSVAQAPDGTVYAAAGPRMYYDDFLPAIEVFDPPGQGDPQYHHALISTGSASASDLAVDGSGLLHAQVQADTGPWIGVATRADTQLSRVPHPAGRRLLVRPDGTDIVITDTQVREYSPTSSAPNRVVDFPGGPLTGASLSPDGDVVVLTATRMLRYGRAGDTPIQDVPLDASIGSSYQPVAGPGGTTGLIRGTDAAPRLLEIGPAHTGQATAPGITAGPFPRPDVWGVRLVPSAVLMDKDLPWFEIRVRDLTTPTVPDVVVPASSFSVDLTEHLQWWHTYDVGVRERRADGWSAQTRTTVHYGWQAEHSLIRGLKVDVALFPDPTDLTVSLDHGDLPPGLALGKSGVLSGIPTQEGTWHVALWADNGIGPAGSSTRRSVDVVIDVQPQCTKQAAPATLSPTVGVPAPIELIISPGAQASCEAEHTYVVLNGGSATFPNGSFALDRSPVAWSSGKGVTTRPIELTGTAPVTVQVFGDRSEPVVFVLHPRAKPLADLAITLTGPSSVSAGVPFDVVVRASNRGPTTATGVVAAILLPRQALLHAGCGTLINNQLLAVTVDRLTNGQQAACTLRLRLDAAGSDQVAAGITSAVHDPRTDDNVAILPLRSSR